MNEFQSSMLLSGCSSGLGKYLHQLFNCDACYRSSSSVPKNSYDYIIHFAPATAPNPNALAESHFHLSQLELCEQLLTIQHQQFIFISFVDINPKKIESCNEDDEIKNGNIDSPINTHMARKHLPALDIDCFEVRKKLWQQTKTQYL